MTLPRFLILVMALVAFTAWLMLYLIPYGRDALFSEAHLIQAYRALIPHYWR